MLVQISDFKNKRNLWQDGLLADAINKGRHPLVVELVDELSRMFGRIGMHDVCAGCFANEPRPRGDDSANARLYQPGGCCGTCPVLGRTQCLCKPMLCATWMCIYTRMRFLPTAEFLDELRSYLTSYKVPFAAWEEGVQVEAGWKPRPTQMAALKKAIARVRAWRRAA